MPSLDLIEDEGGQHGWVWAVPLPYRALTARWCGAVMPAAPRAIDENDGHFEHRLGYYAALQSFLTYSFGWTRPDKGLLWWYREGLPTADERLALISETWEADGTLLGFLAWLASRPAGDLASGTLNRWVRNFDDSPLELGADWRSRLDHARAGEPWNGGYDPLHLGGADHISAPSRKARPNTAESSTPTNTSRLFTSGSVSAEATFVSDTITGWYANLAAAGNELPRLAHGRNWHVDVYVRPIGFLGTYRRSLDTGLWFAGQHRYHAVGN